MDSITGPSILGITIMGKDIFVASGNGVFHSSDNGKNWSPANTGLPEINHQDWPMIPTCIANQGSNLIVGTGNPLDEGAGVFLSKDSGSNWISVNSGLPDNAYITSIQPVGSRIIVATNLNGVFYSDDTCKSWFPFESGLPTNSAITNLMVGVNENKHYTASNIKKSTLIQQGYLFACTNNNGLWRFPIQINTAIESKLFVDQPKIQIFQQANRISITYELKTPCSVYVNLCSISGSRNTLFSNRLETAGLHSANFFCDDFPSGVYILNIKIGSYQKNMKIILLK